MKRKLGFLVPVLMWACFTTMAQNYRPLQVQGGSEFRFVHRTDISDSTYQIFLRKTMIWHGAGCANYNSSILIGSNYRISLVDTCSMRFMPINIVLYYESTSLMNPILPLNPNTGDSASKRIFSVCNSSFPDSIVKYSLPGPYYNNGIGDIQAGFEDTFELIRDYWYDTLIHLPEVCGLWQVQDGALNNSLNPTACGFGSIYSPFGSGHVSGTNIDTNFIPTYIYGNGSSNNVTIALHNGITQINTAVPTSSPYF